MNIAGRARNAGLSAVCLCLLCSAVARATEDDYSVARFELDSQAQDVFAVDLDNDGRSEIFAQQGRRLVIFSATQSKEGFALVRKLDIALALDAFLYDVGNRSSDGTPELTQILPSVATFMPLDFTERPDENKDKNALSFPIDSPFFDSAPSPDTPPLRWRLFFNLAGDKSAESGTGVPPVKNHGQDAHATEVAIPTRSGWTFLGKTESGQLVARSGIVVTPSYSKSVGWGLHGQISCTSKLASPIPGDFDGNGRTDFAFVSGAQLLVFLQSNDGSFGVGPAAKVELAPLAQSGSGDAARSGWVLGAELRPLVFDLNADGLSDLILVFSYDGSVAVHLAKAEGKLSNSPDYVLRVDGWIARAWLQPSGKSGTGVSPVKNHGQDAHATSLLLGICPKLGLWTGLQAAATKQVPVRLESRLFKASGALDETVAWQRAIQAPIEMSIVHWSKAIELGAVVCMNVEMSGDNVPDFLLKADTDEFQVFKGLGAGKYSEEPVTVIPAPELKGLLVRGGIEPVVADIDGDGRKEVVMLATDVQARKDYLIVLRKK